MSDNEQIRASWEAYHGPVNSLYGDEIPQAPPAYSRGYRDGYAAASEDLARARKALARCEEWLERYLSTPVDGYQPIDNGSKAVPPGDE